MRSSTRTTGTRSTVTEERYVASASATSAGRTTQTPIVTEIATTANVRERSFGGRPQCPMSSQTASSGARA